MAASTRLAAVLITLSLVGCPNIRLHAPISPYAFFGVDDAEPLDPVDAERLYEEGNALWAARETDGPLDATIEKWQAATAKDHTRVDILLALSKGYATQYAARGPIELRARIRMCYRGWKVSSQAIEISSPAFVRLLQHDETKSVAVWTNALSLVDEPSAAALYWFAHYDDCLNPDTGRLMHALSRLEALRFEPAEDARWPEELRRRRVVDAQPADPRAPGDMWHELSSSPI